MSSLDFSLVYELGDSWIRISANMPCTLIQCNPLPLKRRKSETRRNKKKKHSNAADAEEKKEVDNPDDDDDDDEDVEWCESVPRSSVRNPDTGLEDILVVGLFCGQEVQCTIVEGDGRSGLTGSSSTALKQLQPSTPPKLYVVKEKTMQRFHSNDLRKYLFPEQLLGQWTDADVQHFALTAPQSCSSLVLPNVQWRNRKVVQRLLSRCFYEGLFTLPIMEAEGGASSSNEPGMWILPNGGQRYCIDLERLNNDVAAEIVSSETNNRDPSANQTQQEGEAGPSDHNHKNGQSVASESDLVDRNTWFRCKKLRRLVRRGPSEQGLHMVVNRNLEDSLRLAQKYHSRPKKKVTRDRDGSERSSDDEGGGTWISSQMIQAFALMDAIGSAPEGHGVKLCAVELINQSGEVLAGCLGFALGCVYHDYTMFTCTRSKYSYGAVLTRLLGCALQHAGYKLWYWGFKLGYMNEFDAHCGGVDLPRDEFYRRWNMFREELPLWSIDIFINSGRAALPATAPSAVI